MTLPALPWDGGCRCGRVRLRISLTPVLTMACHCRGCQRMSASAFSLTAAIPSGGFAVTSGEPVIGGLHGPSQHRFCAYCMSWLFTRHKDMDALVFVRPTLLDEPQWLPPFIETWTSEKMPWVSTPAVRSFEAFPAFSDYSELAAAYAAHTQIDPA